MTDKDTDSARGTQDGRWTRESGGLLPQTGTSGRQTETGTGVAGANVPIAVIGQWETRAIVAEFGYISEPTFTSLFDSLVPLFPTAESTAAAFSLPLRLALALFGPIDEEPAWLVGVLGVGIGPGIDDGLLPLDSTECIRSGFSADYSWSASSSESSTIMGSSNASIRAQTW